VQVDDDNSFCVFLDVLKGEIEFDRFPRCQRA
jgi:hypothetical protein